MPKSPAQLGAEQVYDIMKLKAASRYPDLARVIIISSLSFYMSPVDLFNSRKAIAGSIIDLL